jgi:hypothetical protein
LLQFGFEDSRGGVHFLILSFKNRLIKSSRDVNINVDVDTRGSSSWQDGDVNILQTLPPASSEISPSSSTSLTDESAKLQLSIMEQALAAAVAEAQASYEKIKELSGLVGCHSTSTNRTIDRSRHSHSCLQAAANGMQSQQAVDEAAPSKSDQQRYRY